jgi:hypothetical protein
LFLIISPFSFSMQLTQKKFIVGRIATLKYSSLINRSEKLDKMRQAFTNVSSIEKIINISEGAIAAEEITVGKRYGTCHNYAFTTLMGITGKAPALLNIVGQHDYYSFNGINILDFFSNAPIPHQPGDIIVYNTAGHGPIESINQITHTGIVVGDDLIKSKWGTREVVLVHPTWYVPTIYGNRGTYYRPKITGQMLFKAVKERLEQTEVKELYDQFACTNQQYLFDLINNYQEKDVTFRIWECLEMAMNVHVNVPDKNGLTVRMLAKKRGNKKIIKLLAAYDEAKQ